VKIESDPLTANGRNIGAEQRETERMAEQLEVASKAKAAILPSGT